jgi:hypothetical protein
MVPGKATRIRDVIDTQDLVETFVPFAKRFSWLTRSLTGLVSSAVGSVLVGTAPCKTEKGALNSKKGAMVPVPMRTRESTGTCHRMCARLQKHGNHTCSTVIGAHVFRQDVS